jgi:hypothetical protein
MAAYDDLAAAGTDRERLDQLAGDAVDRAVDRLFWAGRIKHAVFQYLRECYPVFPDDDREVFEHVEPLAQSLGVDEDVAYDEVVSTAIIHAEWARTVEMFDEGDPEQRERAQWFFHWTPETGTLAEIGMRRSSHRHLLGQLQSRQRAPRIGGRRRRGSRRAAAARAPPGDDDPHLADPARKDATGVQLGLPGLLIGLPSTKRGAP